MGFGICGTGLDYGLLISLLAVVSHLRDRREPCVIECLPKPYDLMVRPREQMRKDYRMAIDMSQGQFPKH
jgi:hypothetical protein